MTAYGECVGVDTLVDRATPRKRDKSTAYPLVCEGDEMIRVIADRDDERRVRQVDATGSGYLLFGRSGESL